MLACVAFEYVDGLWLDGCVRVSVDAVLETLTCAVMTRLCGKRNFRRRRRSFPLAFFYQCCGGVRGEVDLRYSFIIITYESG